MKQWRIMFDYVGEHRHICDYIRQFQVNYGLDFDYEGQDSSPDMYISCQMERL